MLVAPGKGVGILGGGGVGWVASQGTFIKKGLELRPPRRTHAHEAGSCTTKRFRGEGGLGGVGITKSKIYGYFLN